MLPPRASTSSFAASASLSRASYGPVNVHDCFGPLLPSSQVMRTDSPRCSGADAMPGNLTRGPFPWARIATPNDRQRSHTIEYDNPGTPLRPATMVRWQVRPYLLVSAKCFCEANLLSVIAGAVEDRSARGIA